MTSMHITEGNLNNPTTLESLKCNLNLVGVRSFTIDFENQAVSIVSHLNLSHDEIQCVFKKAGLNCSCSTKCNSSVD
jgi:hypothetical protein